MSPAWQRSGLGRAMIERLTHQLVEDGISTITLYAEPQVRVEGYGPVVMRQSIAGAVTVAAPSQWMQDHRQCRTACIKGTIVML